MAYMGHTPEQREWLLNMVQLYRSEWHKPNYTARAETLSRMANRAREYKGRGRPNPVAYVIRKSRRLYEAGREFAGEHCSLSSLMSAGMFELIFEAEEPARVRRKEAEERRYAAAERAQDEREQQRQRSRTEAMKRLREDPEAFEDAARRSARFHARARRGFHAAPTDKELEEARARLRDTLAAGEEP